MKCDMCKENFKPSRILKTGRYHITEVAVPSKEGGATVEQIGRRVQLCIDCFDKEGKAGYPIIGKFA